MQMNDFRAFNGPRKFGFDIENGIIADLVVIYAPNGMGKTSFFDSIEWGLTGEIDRFNTDIKANEYQGYILKNRESDSKVTSVEIVLDDEKVIQRKTSKLTKKIKKDYLPGRISKGKDIIESYNDWQSLLLPHNKIDGLISARSPAAKYEYWGSYWDPTGSERKLFDFIYKMKKCSQNQVEEIKNEIKLIKDKMNEFESIPDILNFINSFIDQYNNITNKINKIQNINENTSYEEYKEFKYNVNLLRTTCQDKCREFDNNLNILNLLLTNFEEYKKNLEDKQYNVNLKNRWAKILDKGNIKLKKIQEIRELENDIEKDEELYFKINNIYLAGESWTKEYSNYIESKLTLNSVSENRNSLFKSLASWNDEIKRINLVREENYKEIKQLKESTEELTSILNYIDHLNLKLTNKEKRHSFLNKIGEKLEDKILNIKYKIKSVNEIYVNYEKIFIEKIASSDILRDSEIKNKFLRNLEEKLHCINDIEKKVIEARTRYEESEKLSKELNIIIKESRDYINKSKINVCPLCKAEYDNSEILLKRTLMKINNDESVEIYYKNWCELNEKFQEEKRLLAGLIEDWNLSVDSLKNDVIKEFQEYEKKKNKLELIKEKLNLRINNLQSKKNKELIKVNKIGFKNDQLTNKNIEEWYNQKEKEYKDSFNFCDLKLKEYNNYVDKINLEIKILDKSYYNAKNIKETFEDIADNKLKIAILNELQLSHEWNSICKKKEEIGKLKDEHMRKKKELDNKINNYYWIDVNRIDYYRDKIKKYENIILRDENLKEYVNTYIGQFGNNNINLKTIKTMINKTKKFESITKQRWDILNNISSDEDLEIYYKDLEKLKEDIILKNNLLLKKESACNQLEKSFDSAKEILEKKVNRIFNEDLINDIFKKIDPHPFMKKLKYEITFNENDKPELNIYADSDDENTLNKYLPEWYFSSAQLNVVAISSFLGRALSFDSRPINAIFIDDPIGNFDDINTVAFVDLLRSLVESKYCQIIMSTHDENLFNLIKRKIPGEFYNSKFMEFESVGELKS